MEHIKDGYVLRSSTHIVYVNATGMLPGQLKGRLILKRDGGM